MSNFAQQHGKWKHGYYILILFDIIFPLLSKHENIKIILKISKKDFNSITEYVPAFSGFSGVPR